MQVLLSEGAVQRVAVIDLDVHQGDGTAVCLQVIVLGLQSHHPSNLLLLKSGI